MRFWIVAVTTLAANSLIAVASNTSVKLPQGTLQGFRQTIDGVELDLFLGVPFAKPPTGSLRFAAPVPIPDSHNNTIVATSYGNACLQPGATVPTGEDCLTLNIIRPANLSSDERVPVLHWIYGGAFTTGASALYNGTRLVAASVQADKPIVWVSANYVSFPFLMYYIDCLGLLMLLQRVGPWGFMAGTEFTVASRKNASKTTLNAGLYDQRLALKWVQRNIAKFSGNAKKVTIWGQSAGAISVAIQLIANGGRTDNLFHAAYMTSGSPGYGGILPPSHSRLDQTYDIL